MRRAAGPSASSNRESTPRVLLAAACALLLAGCSCGGSSMQLGGGGASKYATSDAGAPGSGVQDAGAAPTGPELCDNGADDDGDGMVDEDCACMLGATRPCYSASGGAGVGACRAGVRTCEAQGEIPAWSVCRGEVVPTGETCNGIDDDCDGQIDEALTQACSSACGGGTSVCAAGVWGTCSAPQPTAELCNGLDDDCDGQIDESLTLACSSACGGGVQVCSAGNWGSCSARQPAAEICGNGFDDDCDGQSDENCLCIRSPGPSTWQIHQGAPAGCWPLTFPSHGDPGEYLYASIPAENDTGWATHAAPAISFSDPSTLCGVCDCRAGGDFTYFQTLIDVPPGFTVSSLVVSIADVDDGVRVTIFNSTYPSGVVNAGSYAYLGGGSSSNLAGYIVAGKNRIVLTHVDDCCMTRQIANATVSVNGTSLNPCP
ncbi:MAG: MopE-related protein [Myxococcaceae bacterium]